MPLAAPYRTAKTTTSPDPGSLVDAAYAKKYPEIVVAYLRAAIEAEALKVF